MPNGEAKKKRASWITDNLGKVGQGVTHYANAITGGWFPQFQRYTKYKPPVEKILDTMGVTGAFEKYVTAVAKVENMWDEYRGYWMKLIDLYSTAKNEKGDEIGVGLYRGSEYIMKECGRVKYGMGVSKDLIDKETKALKKASKEKSAEDISKEEKELEERATAIITAMAGQEREKIEAELRKEGIPDRIIGGLLQREAEGAVQMRVYNGNLKKEHKNDAAILASTKVTFEYPIPKTIKTRYWHSLMHDKDEVLNDQEYSYFGYNKTPVWIGAYIDKINKVCDDVEKNILDVTPKTKELFNKLEDDEKTNLHSSITALKGIYAPIFTRFLKDMHRHENEHYNYLRDMAITSIQIADMRSELLGPDKLPQKAIEGVGEIYFKHSYKIIDPERLVDVWSWNNVIGLYKELVRLLRIINTDKEGILDEARIKVDVDKITTEAKRRNREFKLDQFWFRYKQDKSEKLFLRPLILDEGKEYQQGLAEYDHGMEYVLEMDFKLNENEEGDLLNFLRYKFREKNLELHNSNLELHNSKEGKSFLMDGIGRFETWPDERAPGWDENAWPLEISDENLNFKNFVTGNSHSGKGWVLLDCYNEHKRPGVREVPDGFVKEMDLLLAATSIHNEWDAVRDDLRDGRYHPGSLTITDYAMAMKRFVGTKSVVGLKSQLPQISMIGEDKLDKRANNNIEDKNNPRRYEMYVYNRDGSINREPEVNIRVPIDLNPAFDRRALKKGKWWHIGRKRYYDFAVNIIEDLDDDEREALINAGVIGPAISSRGISMYIIEQVLFAVPYYKDAKDLLVKLAGKVWYDYGPRGFNKPGSKDPLNIDSSQLAAANKSVTEGE